MTEDPQETSSALETKGTRDGPPQVRPLLSDQRLRSPRSHRLYHKRYCNEHQQDEVCLCTIGADHPERRTTVSKSQQAQARWCERVNRAHRAAWVHERNVRAWLCVYGHDALGARAFVGTYARDVPVLHGCLGRHSADPYRPLWDEQACLDSPQAEGLSEAF